MPEQPAVSEEGAEVAARLEAAFARIHATRMHDVPILNKALSVKVVGQREIDAGWLCALVTPWFINLMILPRTDEQRARLAAATLGTTIAHAFPSGRFEFIVGEEQGLGHYQMCSLFSPVLEFESQGAAVVTAEAALQVLYDARMAPDAASEAPPQAGGGTEPALAERAPDVDADEPKELSRRGLLFGRSRRPQAGEP